MNQYVFQAGRIPFSIIFIAVLILCSFGRDANAQDEYQVLERWLQYSDSPNALYHHLTGDAYGLLDSREEKISGLDAPEQWQQRQTEMKQLLRKTVGLFPEKTPLNARLTGEVKKDGYRIENIIYESLPGFYVTASLFIPDNLKGPAPAILFCSGHSTEVYRKQSYQLPLLNLVKKGFVVLAIDPLGQGERLQYFNPETGKSILGGSTREHSYPSVQTALIGQPVARYFTWDGIRGIDYLVSRKEVDAQRIGVHGISGGGTQTAYISALDERVTASAPACYITSFRRLMESIGVQDGEQNFYRGILNGIDHGDFIVVRAPKPTLIMATTHDFFNIQGTRETYEEVKKVYTILGKPDNMELVEDDYGHGYTKIIREGMYAFFQKHLNNPGPFEEEKVEYLTEKELQKTPTGQLATSLKGETVFSLNRSEAGKYIDELEESRKELGAHLQKIPAQARHLSGYKKPSLFDNPVFTGRIQKEGYVVEKYFVKGEGDYVLPYLLFIPEKKNGNAVIYLHPEGKAGMVKEEDEMAFLLHNGFTLLAPDLPGTGELGGGALKGDAYIDNVSYNLWYTAMLIGRSIVGVQASDVVKLSYLLRQSHGVTDVYGVAREEMSPLLLHAAAFDSVISRVALINPYSSYRSFVENRFYTPRFVYSLVPGALTGYDLPDLAASLAPTKLLITGMTDANSQADDEALSKDLKIVKDAYRLSGKGDQLEIIKQTTGSPEILFGDWIK